jgi:hypothetical protein
MAQLSRDALDDRIARLDALTKGLRTEISNLQRGATPLTGEELRANLDALSDATAALQRGESPATSRSQTTTPVSRLVVPPTSGPVQTSCVMAERTRSSGRKFWRGTHGRRRITDELVGPADRSVWNNVGSEQSETHPQQDRR